MFADRSMLLVVLAVLATPAPAAAQVRELERYLDVAIQRLTAQRPELRGRMLVLAPPRRLDESRFACDSWLDAGLTAAFELSGHRVVVDEARAYWLGRLGEAVPDGAVYKRIAAPAWSMPNFVIRPRIEVTELGFRVLLRAWDPGDGAGVTTALAWSDPIPERVLRQRGGLRCVSGVAVRGRKHPWLTLHGRGGLAHLELSGPTRTIGVPAAYGGVSVWPLSIADRLHFGGRAGAAALPAGFIAESAAPGLTADAVGTATLFLGRGAVQPFLEAAGGLVYIEFPTRADGSVRAAAPAIGGGAGVLVYVGSRWAVSAQANLLRVAPFELSSSPPGGFGPHRFDVNRMTGLTAGLAFIP